MDILAKAVLMALLLVVVALFVVLATIVLPGTIEVRRMILHNIILIAIVGAIGGAFAGFVDQLKL